jgi:hypothetical protein
MYLELLLRFKSDIGYLHILQFKYIKNIFMSLKMLLAFHNTFSREEIRAKLIFECLNRLVCLVILMYIRLVCSNLF